VNSVHTHTSRRARTALRLSEAKRLMLAGEPPAMAAAAAGFADQSHLIRKFKEAYGVIPGQYLEQCNNVQSTANEGCTHSRISAASGETHAHP
jgi:AraC-like DNA-binding protein